MRGQAAPAPANGAAAAASDASAPNAAAAAGGSPPAAGPPWAMAVAERRAGAPCSALAALTLAALPDAHIVAVGGGDGTIALYLLQGGHEGHGGGHAADAAAVTPPASPSPALLLRLTDLAGAEVKEPVTQLAWGGGGDGRAVALAAAAGSRVFLLSLQPFVDRPVGDASDGAAAAEAPTQHQLLAVGELPANVVALAWAQACDGILVSDTGGGVTMLHVRPRWLRLPDAVAAATGRLSAGGNGAVAAGAHPAAPAAAPLEDLWHVQMPEPQTLIAAGAGAWAPSATAAAGGGHVTVWWPQPIAPHDGDPTAPGSPAKQLSARAERLRHPGGVAGLQWSPGGALGHASPQMERIWGGAGDEEEGDAAHPALLTTGSDGVLRLWVEVRLSPMLGSDGMGAAAAAAPAHFCCTLVVSPPGAAPGAHPGAGAAAPPGAGAGIAACWGRPPPDASFSVAGSARRAAKVLWVAAAGADDHGHRRLWLWAVDRLSGVTMNGLPNQTAGSRLLAPPRAVLWGTAQLHGGSGDPAAQAQAALSCHVNLDGDVPAMSLVEGWQPDEASLRLRTHRVDAFGGGDAGESPASPPAPSGFHSRQAPALQHMPVRCHADLLLGGHGSRVRLMAADPGGRLLATAAATGPPLLWRMPDLDLAGPATGLSSGQPYTALAWLRVAGQQLLAAAHGSTVSMLPISGGDAAVTATRPLLQLMLPSESAGTVTGLWQLPAAQPGGRMAEGAADSSSGGRAAPLVAGWLEQIDREPSIAIWQLPNQVAAPAAGAEPSKQVPLAVLPAGIGGGVGSGRGCPGDTAVSTAQLGDSLLLAAAAGGGEVRVLAVTAAAGSASQPADIEQVARLDCGAGRRLTALALSPCGGWLAASSASHAIGGSGGELHIWHTLPTASGPLRFDEPVRLPLPAAAAALAFVPQGGVLPPLLAAACGEAGTQLWCQEHGGGWSQLAAAPGGVLATALLLSSPAQPGPGAAVLAAEGSQLLSLSDRLRPAGDTNGEGVPVAAAAAAAAGPLPAHHPAALAAALAAGNAGYIAAAVRSATQHDQDQSSPNVGELLDARWLAWAQQLAASDDHRSDAEGAAAPVAAASSAQHPSGQQQPASAVDTGMLDMSAFGLASEPEPQPSQQQLPLHKSQQSAVDTGMLDMSAFGLESEPEPQPPPQQPQLSALDTGMLDMSAFGLTSKPEPQQQPRQQPQQSALDTGMLDMSAFGLEPEPQPQQQSAVETGMLDMSAFGFASEPQQQQQQAQTPGSSSAASQLDSGQLDMSAFGLVPPPPQLPRVATAPNSLAASAALETGQLDMSAFGMSGFAADSSVSEDAAGQAVSAAQQPATPGKVSEPRRSYATANGDAQLGSASVAQRRVQQSAAASAALPEAASLTTAELLALRRRLGVPEEAGGGSRKQEAAAAHRADASAFSLLRLDAPETAMRDSSTAAPEDGTGLYGRDAEGADVDADGPTLLGLSRPESLQVLPLAQLAAESTAGAAGGTASQFLSTGGGSGGSRFGGGGHGGGGYSSGSFEGDVYGSQPGQAAALDAAGRRAVLAVQLGMLQHTPSAQQQAAWLASIGLLPGFGGDALLWAIQSGSQAALLDRLLPLVPEETPHAAGDASAASSFLAAPAAPPTDERRLSWALLRAAGAGFWLTDAQLVRSKAEELAKAQYAAQRDPHACALMYIALGKKSLLQGLFRMGGPKKLADFLARGFDDAGNRAAAAKNAYVLLGQHKQELAAAFFVLAGEHKDAVGVCAREMGDPQLAMFLARLLEPPAAGAAVPGPSKLLRRAIEAELLPEARAAGDVWGAAALHWAAGDVAAAVDALSAAPPPRLPAGNAALCSALAALEMLRHCSSAAASLSRGQKRSVAQLAAGAAAAAEALGQPLLALSLLHVAACAMHCGCGSDGGSGGGGGGGGAANQEAGKGVLVGLGITARQQTQQRLAAAAALQAMGVAGPAVLDRQAPPRLQGGQAWRAAAAAQLARLADAGLLADTSRALELAVTYVASLQPAPDAPPELLPHSPSAASVRSRRSSSITGNSVHASLAGGPPISAEASWEVLRAPHGRLLAAAAANDGSFGLGPGAEPRPFAAASSAGGLLQGRIVPPADAALLESPAGTPRGWAFSSLVSSVFDAVRWPPDPWEVLAPTPQQPGQQALQVQQQQSSPQQQQSSPQQQRSPQQQQQPRPKLAQSTSMVLRQDPVAAALAHVQASASAVLTSTLDAHPSRPLYLSGSAGGEVYLWRFGDAVSTAGYTPLTDEPDNRSGALATSPTLTFAPVAGRGAATAAALPHWGRPASVRWSGCGERFAAVGEGGLLATWRLDAPRRAGLGRADWALQVLQRRGCDVAFVGGSSSVLAAGGLGGRGINVAIWDTLAPPQSACIGTLLFHQSTVTSLAALPGGRLLASADEDGHLVVTDVRSLGTGLGARPLWEARDAHPSGVSALAAGRLPGGASVLASGGRDGGVRLWASQRGQALAAVDTAQFSRGRGFFADALQHHRHEVTGLQLVDDGLLVCGMDGALRFFPFNAA